MSIVFFEGFNYSDSDSLKLNPEFWSVNDPAKLSFGTGRTNNEVRLQNRNSSDSLSNNTILSLQNFTDPLVSASGFSCGFFVNNGIAHRPTDASSDPYLENFVKFYDDSNEEVLSIDIIRTSGFYGDSLGFGVYQNNSLVDVYDFKSHVGYSWNIFNAGFFLYLLPNAYVDIYVDPINSGHVAINLSASNTNNAQLRNTSDEYYTSISGFNSLNKIEFYSQHNGVVYTMNLDDLYIKSGNSRQEAVIGNSVKIYKVTFDNNTAQNNWPTFNNSAGSEYSYLNSNNGDADYVISSNSGDVGIYNLNNLPGDSPSGIGGIKISNIVRSSDIDVSWQMVNVVSDGVDVVEDANIYNINSATYSHKETFIFENPITGSGWTKTDINNLQVGIKNLGII